MGKRFTGTEKWADPWFRKLPPKYKCFWTYLCDNCDGGGVWNEDMESASFHIGEKITHEEAIMALEGRVQLFDYRNETHWLLPNFVGYQVKEPKVNHNPHNHIWHSFAKYNLVFENGEVKPNPNPSRTLHEPLQGTLQDKDKDTATGKDMGKDKVKAIGKAIENLEKVMHDDDLPF